MWVLIASFPDLCILFTMYVPDCTVSNTKFSSVTLNELAMKARERGCNFDFQQDYKKTDIKLDGVQVMKTCLE